MHFFNTIAKNIQVMQIGNKLRGLRNENGFSTAELADRLDISETTYRRYETDKNFPDIFTLDKIAKIYNKNIAEILPAEMIVINNNEQRGGQSANALIINQYLSEKLVEQYEQRIVELKEEVTFWRAKTNH